jgi:hypothetical protein
VKNGAALDDAARSILAGSQWGGDLVLPVGAWWPPGGATADCLAGEPPRLPVSASSAPHAQAPQERQLTIAFPQEVPSRFTGSACRRATPKH